VIILEIWRNLIVVCLYASGALLLSAVVVGFAKGVIETIRPRQVLSRRTRRNSGRRRQKLRVVWPER
jgi:hypothetical protein